MSEEIQILSEVEAVRQNPWMYIGSVGEEGAHQLLFEIVQNALDEALLGHAKRIEIVLDGAVCEVADDGRGIPTEVHSKAGVPACEVALTRLHAGSKFRRDETRFTAGLHGVGLSCVNALSSRLEVAIDRRGRRFTQVYEKGQPLHPLRETAASDGQGTRIRFTPDPAIFKSFTHFDAPRIQEFAEDLALLHPGVEIHFRGAGIERTFLSREESLRPLFKKFARGRRLLLPQIIPVRDEREDFLFDAVFGWGAENDAHFVSFVNSVRTVHGGTHVNAFRSGVALAVNKMMGEIGKGAQADIADVCEGLIAIVNCKAQRPNFEGQTKSRFTNLEVAPFIESATALQVEGFFRQNPKAAAVIFERISEVRNARLAAKRVADRVYYQHARKEINEEVYKEQFGARSKNWHDSAVWITHQELLKSHAELCEMGDEAIALDVCCGSGVVGASFKGKVKKVIGLDLTPEMVNLAKQRLDDVVQGNVYNIPFPDNTFDLVCTREVLHLLPYPERPVSEIFRVLKPGGQFIVGQILPFSEDDAPWMYRVFKKKQPLIFNMFQEEDFRRLLLSPGFVDMQMTEMNVWESIDVWIDSYETTSIHRHEIRELFRQAPAEARAVHPFKIGPNGEIEDLWRWCVFSVRKPAR